MRGIARILFQSRRDRHPLFQYEGNKNKLEFTSFLPFTPRHSRDYRSGPCKSSNMRSSIGFGVEFVSFIYKKVASVISEYSEILQVYAGNYPFGQRRTMFLQAQDTVKSVTEVGGQKSFKVLYVKRKRQNRRSKLHYGGQRRNMFMVVTEEPNPRSQMFFPGKPVLEFGNTKDFPDARSAIDSPLAKSLFAIDGVTRVFWGPDFVTVTKSEEASWDYLKPQVFNAIASGTALACRGEFAETKNAL